jgi:hypothetical protein
MVDERRKRRESKIECVASVAEAGGFQVRAETVGEPTSDDTAVLRSFPAQASWGGSMSPACWIKQE